MDGDIGAMLQSVLSDPEQMARLTQMAQGLMGGGAPAQEPSPSVAGPPSAAPATDAQRDARLLSSLGRLFSQNTGQSRSTALLTAMRPYMRPEKQEKLDRAMKLAGMARVVSEVMREIGGNHGV